MVPSHDAIALRPPRTQVNRYRDDPNSVPRELAAALAAEPDAKARFDALPPTHRREFAQWVAEARRDDSRERRAAQTVMRLLSGSAGQEPSGAG